MSRPMRHYRVIASRNDVDLGFLLVSATDESSALIGAFWDLRDAFQISPHDFTTQVRVELNEPWTLN